MKDNRKKALLGLVQLVKRRGLLRVDPDILLLGAYYVLAGHIVVHTCLWRWPSLFRNGVSVWTDGNQLLGENDIYCDYCHYDHKWEWGHSN